MGYMDMATYFFLTMSSEGMIVTAVEHTDGTTLSMVLEDRYKRRFNKYFKPGGHQSMMRALELLEAAKFFYRRRLSGNSTTPGTMMLGGHSYGALSVVLLCSLTPSNHQT